MTPIADNGCEFLSYEAAGAQAGVSVRTIARWVKAGMVDVRGTGSARKVLKSSLAAYELSLTLKAAAPSVFEAGLVDQQKQRVFREFLLPMVREIVQAELKFNAEAQRPQRDAEVTV